MEGYGATRGRRTARHCYHGQTGKIQTGLTSYFGEGKERVEPATLVAGIEARCRRTVMKSLEFAQVHMPARSARCYINNKKSLEDRQHFSDHAYQSFSVQGEVR